MAIIDPASLPHVIEASVVNGLGERLVEIGNNVRTSFAGAVGRWH